MYFSDRYNLLKTGQKHWKTCTDTRHRVAWECQVQQGICLGHQSALHISLQEQLHLNRKNLLLQQDNAVLESLKDYILEEITQTQKPVLCIIPLT